MLSIISSILSRSGDLESWDDLLLGPSESSCINIGVTLSSSPLTAPPTAPYVSWMMITGASKGIGRAFSIALARRRHNNSNYGIIVVARQSEKLKLLAKEIEDCYGLKVVTIPCDLSKDGDVHALMKTIERKQLRIELVVANAGIGDRNDFVTLSPTKMNMVLNLNVIIQ